MRVWNSETGEQIFVGWGHICRVWDVLFYGENEEEIITCGEDCTIKLWKITNLNKQEKVMSIEPDSLQIDVLITGERDSESSTERMFATLIYYTYSSFTHSSIRVQFPT